MIAVATREEVQPLVESLDVQRRVLGRPVYRVAGEELLVTGVGSTNAAATITAALQEAIPDRIVSCGLAGALPDSELRVGDVVVGTEAVYADLGIQHPDGFHGTQELGFETTPGTYNRYPLQDIPLDAARGHIAEVSTVSATMERARDVRERTDALVETMETTSAAHTATLHNVPAGAIVAVSNHASNERDFDFEAGKTALCDALEQLLNIP